MTESFDHTVDVLIVGSGGGGMTAALAADAFGLDALIVEKSAKFGGSTALSGGGIWVPGAPAQRREGYAPDPDGVFEYLRQITGGLVSDARLRTYIDSAPEMMEFLERLSPWFEFVWKPGYADYYPDLPGGSELGSTINVPAIDLRKLGDEEQNLLQPLALAPKGIWFAPKDLRLFYQIRQNWRGKVVLAKLIWRMVRAHVFGDRMAAIGQSLAARMRLALKDRGVPLWLNSPMRELITDADGAVIGAVVEREGTTGRIRARRGVILAAGGFDHDLQWRRKYLPLLEKDWSFGNPAAMGDGIRAGEKVGGSTDLLDEAWWFPAICWPDGRLQFMLNERMMPSQFVVNGAGKRFINEAAPYMDFAHAMIEGQKSGVQHIPCWLITDIRSFRRYVIAGHLPIPKVPFAPVPTGRHVPRTWLESGVVKEGNSFEELAVKIGVPPEQLRATADRFNELARKGHDDDFNRGDSAYDNYYGDPTLPNPNLYPLGKPPYYAFQIILGDLGTSGGLRTDEFARVLRADDSVVPGLYAVGNNSAALMGRSYAGAGATIGPAMTFGYVAAKHLAGRLGSGPGPQTDSAHDSGKVTK
ncbi:3-oxosteroid 1-dehydrogenase [Mycolicibacterium hassiacum DSM 44199]|jgi:succinate dehydrogenase/fumarate reductase flavoprotein subunit|uniref:3-oxosteroid 1-dehydrogenase n=1 Tax=Mycolicibacterium hassiacum (strain DSM 44199 / CIP 105218 / JCM 12690 / 3849) TaxID=1122247 RepID=K5BHF4_MYCHD|nr:FAD-binding protein [Mycolicibacterium hassiacum]EKF25647.1 3-oxosteroid 1-dehydrogenase [Mycolicibacterium hassiacum DSM 44199]MBX5485654.1 FAD-binding protein [Mycolicibacterium hassiacum]MDA4084565.1 3-ketosteroid-delta-1-dehydrogenase [Mycolicibacterium hassiacum DSM 44199]VCT90921.1 3-oxosteroid 1-dehydrogenase [Mycolicibacterium hassiacum DSM 44199]